MSDSKEISKLVKKAVAEVFDSRVEELKQQVIERVTEALEPMLEDLAKASKSGKKDKDKEETAAGGAPTDLLYAAVSSVYDANGQADILKALLDGSAQFIARTALFVVKAGNLASWQARGFDGDLKGINISGSSGLAGRALQDKEPVSAAAAEFDSEFISRQGNPFDGNATLHPLVVRDKVAAILYTDAGTDPDGLSDQSSVRVLVRSASSWLEILALRKSGGGVAEASAPEPVAQAAAAPAPSAPEPPPPAPEPPPPAKAAPAPAADISGLSSEDQEVHKKAKRFAKLLVDEIKLYNQAKVTEGRQNKDLYSRLKEDIDKSRNTYEKRYGSSVAASANYFHSEVIRILGDNDASALGEDFQ